MSVFLSVLIQWLLSCNFACKHTDLFSLSPSLSLKESVLTTIVSLGLLGLSLSCRLAGLLLVVIHACLS